MRNRLQAKMAAPIARHVEPGEYVEMRPEAIIELHGRRDGCALYLTNRAIYLVVDDRKVLARLRIRQLVEMAGEPSRFELRWRYPDGNLDGLVVYIVPVITARLFMYSVLTSYEQLTGEKLPRQ